MATNTADQFIQEEAFVPIRARLAFVYRYVKQHRGTLISGALSMIGRDGVSFAIPLLIRSSINRLASGKGDTVLDIAWIGLGITVVALVRAGFQTVSRLKLIGTSRRVEYAMRRDLLQHLFRLDAPFWSRMRTGDIMAYATNDLSSVRMMLGPGLTQMFAALVSLPIAVIVLVSVNWKLTIAALLPAPLAVFLLIRYGAIIRRRFDRIQALFSTLSAAVQQTVAGARVVRSFVREKQEQARIERMNRAYIRSNCILGVYSSTLDPFLSAITYLSVLIVLWYGGSLVLSGHLSVGNFVMFTTYMAMLGGPISSLGSVVNVMQRGMASLTRLQLLFQETPIIEPGEWLEYAHGKEPAGMLGAVTFDNVSMNFGSYAALDSVHIDIPAGSTLAILGETGSGKTTLVKLLTRIMEPTSGRILIDGADYKNFSLAELRTLVGVVPQETFLFSMTLAENIALGVQDATRAEIEQAAEIAGLAPDLAAMPAGFDTIVGERGIMLSGGQKQRIAIARAVLKNPRILVLDDSLSSVDSVTEQRILEHLKSVMSHRTTILITHRVATAMRANSIVVFDHGRIVEQGTHDSLLACNGRYARLSRVQVLEEELEVM